MALKLAGVGISLLQLVAAAPNVLAERGSTCQTTCLAAQVTGDLPKTSAFCSNYLTYTVPTSTVLTTKTNPPVTSTITSTSVAVSVSTLPPTTVTSTARCVPSGANMKDKRTWWNWNLPSNQGPSSSAPAPQPTPKTCTKVSPCPQGAVCGGTGVLTSPCLLKITRDDCIDNCRDSCLNTPGCASYSFLQGLSTCSLFSKSISQQGFWQFGGPLVHYDASCWSCKDNTPPSSPSCAPSAVSSACSCLVTPPAATTVTQTVTQPGQTSLQTTTVVSTSASTAPGPVSTKTVTLPNTQSGTYTSPYGGTYAEFQNTDFNGGTLLSGTCYSRGQGFDVNGNLVPCTNLRGCEDVCSYVNSKGGYNGQTCAGVTYHPNPDPDGYSTCYLKSRVPDGSTDYCGEVPNGERVDSAILLK